MAGVVGHGQWRTRIRKQRSAATVDFSAAVPREQEQGEAAEAQQQPRRFSAKQGGFHGPHAAALGQQDVPHSAAIGSKEA